MDAVEQTTEPAEHPGDALFFYLAGLCRNAAEIVADDTLPAAARKNAMAAYERFRPWLDYVALARAAELEDAVFLEPLDIGDWR